MRGSQVGKASGFGPDISLVRVQPSQPRLCENCSSPITSKYAKRFCGSSCAATFNNTGRIHSVTTRQKISDSVSFERLAASDTTRAQRVANSNIHALAESQRVYKTCRCGVVFYGANYKCCSNECARAAQQEFALNQINTGCGSRGTYNGIYFQSSWEWAFLVWAFAHRKTIRRSRLRIPYEFEGRARMYNPDFEIGRNVYEIKGFINGIAEAKISAATTFLGSRFKLITDITPYMRYASAHENSFPRR